MRRAIIFLASVSGRWEWQRKALEPPKKLEREVPTGVRRVSGFRGFGVSGDEGMRVPL